MRKVATLPQPVNRIRRVMLHEADGGAFLYLFTRDDDGPCEFDTFHESARDAEDAAAEAFGIGPGDWTLVDDPPAGAQADCVAPTRAKRDAAGNVLPGQFEAIPPEG